MNASMPTLRIKSGRCSALFAYDVGMLIDLDAAEARITEVAQRGGLKHKRRAPIYFEYRPLPLRITRRVPNFAIAGFRSEATIEVTLFDFGAAQLSYTIPISGDLEALHALSMALYDNVLLLSDSKQQLEQILAMVAPAVTRPRISDFVEDYFIYELQLEDPQPPLDEVVQTHAHKLAQILRAEESPLSAQEVADALSVRMSFTPSDLALIDWGAAIVFDQDAEDVRTVLEFANVELLEMRHMDQELDDALEQAYTMLSGPALPWWQRLFHPHSAMEKIAQLQVDNALLFESVNNALKLLGDQYMARVYTNAAKRFHLADWDASILRKLSTLESIYEKITERVASQRMELLEWIIIVLIALSIVVTLPGIAGK
ncbi:MAG: hypothetical protein KatS3mg130_0614 [Candidatus Sumerlaea sp.]|nr:MAG: hypothetical protein KatS3mg130_0614 [Candidatus Sumerlaea sp.]